VHTCWECDAVGEVHHHHPVPKSRGGTRTIPLCIDCHGKAHEHRMAGAQLTRDGLAAKKAKGELVGAVPYGYDLGADGKTLVANEAEQLVVTAVREYRAAGLSLRTIGERLAERGMVPRKGGAWNPAQIKRIAESAQCCPRLLRMLEQTHRVAGQSR